MDQQGSTKGVPATSIINCLYGKTQFFVYIFHEEDGGEKSHAFIDNIFGSVFNRFIHFLFFLCI